jgi:translation initiation factor IF-2
VAVPSQCCRLGVRPLQLAHTLTHYETVAAHAVVSKRNREVDCGWSCGHERNVADGWTVHYSRRARSLGAGENIVKKRTTDSASTGAGRTTMQSVAMQARGRWEAAKKQARQAKQQAKHARRQFKDAKKTVKRAKEEMLAAAKKLQALLARAVGRKKKATAVTKAASKRKRPQPAKAAAAASTARKQRRKLAPAKSAASASSAARKRHARPAAKRPIAATPVVGEPTVPELADAADETSKSS